MPSPLAQLVRRLILALGLGAVVGIIAYLLRKRLTYEAEVENLHAAHVAHPAPADSLASSGGPTTSDAKPVVQLKRKGRRQFACFVSHAKQDASMEARFLQTELQKALGKKCFLDSDDLRDLSKLQQHVRDSDCIVLVQSTNVLSRPVHSAPST